MRTFIKARTDQDGKPLANQRVLLRKGDAEWAVVLDKEGYLEMDSADTEGLNDVAFPDTTKSASE